MIRNMKKMLIILMGFICYTEASVNNLPVAYIGESLIVGQRVERSYLEADQYLGIPYAEPPVRNLRFMSTVPIRSLPEVLTADHQPPACIQYTKNPYPWYINDTQKSEDCLYLNIWTPTNACPQNTKAVLYWIHGGGYRYGSIRNEVFSGIALAAMGDIVVVTVNYRVGPFGFLTSGTEDAPGNAGMWDILEGLRWVNRNIGAFGGDTARITIAGQSAGSMAVGVLGISPLSRNLFTRQIMQSGSPAYFGFGNNTNNLKYGQILAKLAECANETYTINNHPAEVVKCLKGVDANTLGKMDSQVDPHNTMDFFPHYDDELLPKNPRIATANGDFRCTELLIGNTKEEGSGGITTADPDAFGFFGEKNHQVNKTAGKKIIETFIPFPPPEDVAKHYLPDDLPDNCFDTIKQQVYTSIGDAYLLCPTVYTAEKCAEKGKNVYYYFFVHRPSTSPWAPWMGVVHNSEIEFVFGQPVLNPQRYEPEEVPLSAQMIEIWSSFVKCGKPSYSFWPLYHKDSPNFKYIGFGTDLQWNGIGPHRQNCDFLRPYYGF